MYHIYANINRVLWLCIIQNTMYRLFLVQFIQTIAYTTVCIYRKTICIHDTTRCIICVVYKSVVLLIACSAIDVADNTKHFITQTFCIMYYLR